MYIKFMEIKVYRNSKPCSSTKVFISRLNIIDWNSFIVGIIPTAILVDTDEQHTMSK